MCVTLPNGSLLTTAALFSMPSHFCVSVLNVNTFVSMPSVSVLKADQHISKREIVEKELSESEKGALMRYIGPDSYLLNDKLRRGARLSKTEKTWIQELDAALEKFPNYEGDVIRVVDFAFKEDREEFFDEFNIGFDKSFDQYISSSKKEGYNENAQVIIYIKSKTGKDISLYNPEESEVLFKRNACFTCLDKKKENDHYYIWLEEEYDV